MCYSITSLKHRFQYVSDQIHVAEQACRREGQVQLLAVSKAQPATIVDQAWQLGQKHFGESYLQEALAKMRQLHELTDLHWHFIGTIQSNKTRSIANNFQWVHSVDRFAIAQRLNNQRSDTLPPLNICLQVNISGEVSKSGVYPDELLDLVKSMSNFPRLTLRGLMGMPAPESDVTQQRACYRQLAELWRRLNQQLSLNMDTLSMGMTNDYDVAIEEGATIVRVGTALFGARDYTAVKK